MHSEIILEYLTKISNSSLEVIHSRHFDQNSDIWILEEHRHNYLELIYFITGKAQVMTPQGKEGLTLYDVLIHPKNVPHREFVDLHNRQEIYNIAVQTDVDIDINESFILKDTTGNLRRVFAMLHNQANCPGIMQKELMQQLIHLLITYLQKSAAEHSLFEISMVDQIIEYVQENYMNPLTVKELADYVHVSESYLSRTMTAHIGMPPIKYVNHVRIENAKLALKTEHSIEEIASLTGFRDSKYFTTVFKRQTGMPPSAFRKSFIT